MFVLRFYVFVYRILIICIEREKFIRCFLGLEVGILRCLFLLVSIGSFRGVWEYFC